MGFLDNKGVKKVVNWVKDYVKNNSLAEGDLQNKQDIWDTNYGSYIAPYKINMLESIGFTIVFDAVLAYGGAIIPDINKEYKIRGMGRYLKTAVFPSTFDMPWPNNEIPEWEKDHEYEIYIAGGRVVSVDDITPPIEEVTYIIEASEGCTFNLGGGTDWLYKLNNSNWNSVSAYIDLTLSVGENVVHIRNTSRNGLINVDIVKITNYNYLKIDCSKIKSNNLHKVLGSLKVDEIIYPQDCIGGIQNPAYEFEAPEVGLWCLKYNALVNPIFNFKTDNFINIVFNRIHFSEYHHLFGKNISNINANKILRTIVLSSNLPLSSSNLEGLKTVGTLNDDVIAYNLKSFPLFINMRLPEGQPLGKYSINEVILDCQHNPINVQLNHKYEYNILYIKNCDFENSTFENMSTNSKYTLNIYHSDVIPQDVIDNSQNCNFIKINDISEIPFKYAPATWDDVKNYDDDGNVID